MDGGTRSGIFCDDFHNIVKIGLFQMCQSKPTAAIDHVRRQIIWGTKKP